MCFYGDTRGNPSRELKPNNRIGELLTDIDSVKVEVEAFFRFTRIYQV